MQGRIGPLDRRHHEGAHMRLGTESTLLQSLVVVALVSLIWGGTLSLVHVERVNAQRDVLNSTRDLAGIYEVQMIRALHDIEQILGMVRYACAHQGHAQSLASLSSEGLLPSSWVFSISVANAAGDVVVSNEAKVSGSIRAQPRFQFFASQPQSDRLYSARETAVNGRQAKRMWFARRLIKPDGAFDGVVSVSVDLEYFTSSYDNARMGDLGLLGLLDKEGRLLVRRRGDQMVFGGDDVRPLSLPVAGEQAIEPRLLQSEWDGEARYTALRPLSGFPVTIVVGLSEREQLQAVRVSERNLLSLAAGATVVVLAFSMGLWRVNRSRLRIRQAQVIYHAASEASQDANLVLRRVGDVTHEAARFVVVNVNARAETLIGCTKAQLIGAPFASALPSLAGGEIFAALSAVAASGGTREVEWENESPAIRARWLRAQVLRAADSVVLILQDISEGKRSAAELMSRNAKLTQLNEALLQTQQQLVQSEKLASIGLLAAGVAHEINNPVGFVLSNITTLDGYIANLFEVLDGYTQLEPLLSDAQALARMQALKQRIELDYLKEDIPALMGETKDGIERVRKIVLDLKNFSRVDSTQDWQEVDLHEGINSTLNVVSNEIKYKADVVKVFGVLPPVACLPSEINQVLMNLFVNAAHAIGPDRGQITVRTGVADDDVWIEVADTGCGIAPDNLARIFDPFFTTKAIGKGTGLGLSLSYGIVKKHGGRLEVVSQVGKGSTFRMTIPVQHVQAEPVVSG